MKPKNTCCVPHCLSISGTITRRHDCIFHKFPTSTKFRQEWLKRIKLEVENLDECDQLKVCQKHFRKCHQVNGTNDLLPFAIPSLHLDDPKFPAKPAVKVPKHKPNLIRKPRNKIPDVVNFIATNNDASRSLPNIIFEAIDPLAITNVVLEPKVEEAVKVEAREVIEIVDDDDPVVVNGEDQQQPVETVRSVQLVPIAREVELDPSDTGEFTVVPPPAAAAASPEPEHSQLRQLLMNPEKSDNSKDEKLTHLLLVHKETDIDVQIARDYRETIFSSIEQSNPDCAAIAEFMTAHKLHNTHESDKKLHITYGGIDGSLLNDIKIKVRSSTAPETTTTTTTQRQSRLNDSCRVCLQPQGVYLKNIKTETIDECPADEILHFITKQFTARIDQSQFPTHICTKCLRELRQSYRFITQVERSYKALRRHLSSAPTRLPTASDSQGGGGAQPDVALTCLKCQKHFINFPQLQIHACPFRPDLKTSQILPEDDYCCKFCNHRFTYFLNLTRHICHAPKTTQSKLIECKHCNKKFPTKSQYAQHRQLKNHQIPNFCYDCDIGFETRKRYATHRAVFLHEDEQACKFCGEHVKNDQIQLHLRRHKTKYTCRYCDGHFWGIYDYKTHLKSHFRDRSEQNRQYSEHISDKIENQLNTDDSVDQNVQKPPKTFSKTLQTISIPPNPFQYTPNLKKRPPNPEIKQTTANINQNAVEMGENTPRLGQNVVKLGQNVRMGQNVVKMGQNVVKSDQNLNTKGQNRNIMRQPIILEQKIVHKRDIRKLDFYDIEQHIIKFGQNTNYGQKRNITSQSSNKSGQTAKLSQNIDKPQSYISKSGQNSVNMGQNQVNMGQTPKIGQNCLILSQNVSKTSQNVPYPQQNEAKLGQNSVTDQKGQKRQIGQVLDEISSPSIVKIARIDHSSLKTVQYLNKTGQNASKPQNTPVLGQTSTKTRQFIAKGDKNILKLGKVVNTTGQTKNLVIMAPTANTPSPGGPGVGQNREKTVKYIFNQDNVTKIGKILATLSNNATKQDGIEN